MKANFFHEKPCANEMLFTKRACAIRGNRLFQISRLSESASFLKGAECRRLLFGIEIKASG
jgi:hypothetical protein